VDMPYVLEGSYSAALLQAPRSHLETHLLSLKCKETCNQSLEHMF
jgi:hypothetical protein